MNTTQASPRIRAATALTVLLPLAVLMSVFGIARADDKKPKPQPAVTENVSFNFTQVQTMYINGDTGPSVSVDGVLHLVSQALLSANGVPFAFSLHANISDSAASSDDGTQLFVPVGASATPAECESAACPPPFWTVTFRLVPQTAAVQPSLFFNLILHTQYDAKGALVDTCIFGQPGCDSGIGFPPATLP